MNVLDGTMLRDVKIRISKPEPKLKFDEIRKGQELGRDDQKKNVSRTAVEATAPWFGVYEVRFVVWPCEVVVAPIRVV